MKFKKSAIFFLLAAVFASSVSCISDNGAGTETKNIIDDSGSGTQTTEDPYADDMVPSDIDFDGIDIMISVGDLNGTVYNTLNQEEETGNKVEDSIYRVSKGVQERLNANFVWDVISVDTGNQTKHPSAFASRILAGDQIDLYFGVLDFTAQMAEGRYFENLHETEYFNIDQPWYRQTVADALPDYLFAIAGDFSLYNARNVMCMYYNDDLYRSFGKTEDLYALVDNGKWTLDKMSEVIKDTFIDVNGDTEQDPGDSYGLTFGDCNKYTGFMPALGVSIFKKTSTGFEFTFGNERAVDAMTMLNHIVNDSIDVRVANFNNDQFPEWQVPTTGGTYVSKPFLEGRSVFTCALVGDAEYIVPQISFNYGLLPYPKFSEEEEYRTEQLTPLYVMIPVTANDKDTSSAVIEALGSLAYKTEIPEYCEVALKVRYSADDNISRMFDLVRSVVSFDPGRVSGMSLDYPEIEWKDCINIKNVDWASRIAKKSKRWITLMDQFANISY